MNRGTNLLFHSGIAIVLIIELFVGYEFLMLDSMMRLPVFAVHLILAAIFCALFKKIKTRNFEGNSNFVHVALALSIVLPVYGMFGMFFVYLFIRNIKIEPREYFETDEHFLSGRYKIWIKSMERSVPDIKRNQLDIDAFRDVLNSNDRELEENAINKLSRSLNKESVNILKEVVNTSASDTKVLAASALTEMEDKIVDRIENLRATVHDNPDNREAVLELARAYDLYCYLGVLDAVSEKYYQNLSVEQYETFLQFDSGHREANLEYGRILLNAGKTKEAIKNLRLAWALAPEEINPQIWLAEAYYRSADYEEVRKICQKLAESVRLPENIKEVVNLWTNNEEVGS